MTAMKRIGIIAIASLSACTFSPDRMFYEVSQSNANGVIIQANIGNMDRQSPEVAQMAAHMDGMAFRECEELGKSAAGFTDQRTYTAGPYHSWLERTYRCQ